MRRLVAALLSCLTSICLVFGIAVVDRAVQLEDSFNFFLENIHAGLKLCERQRNSKEMCLSRNESGTYGVLLLGDSRAAHIKENFFKHFKLPGKQVKHIAMTAPGCPFFEDISSREAKKLPPMLNACRELNLSRLENIRALNPEIIIIYQSFTSWSDYFETSYDSRILDAFTSIHRVSPSSLVVHIGPSIKVKFSSNLQYWKSRNVLNVDLSEYSKDSVNLESTSFLKVFEFDLLLCARNTLQVCLSKNYFLDEEHLSFSGARIFIRQLVKTIDNNAN